jgi:hypothetical protein
MQVRIYDIDEKGNETSRGESDLRECFPDDNNEFGHAFAYLRQFGRYYAGGGAAPFILLINTDR